MFQENLLFDVESPVTFQETLDDPSRRLHERAISRAKRYLAAEADLLETIMEVDEHRLFEKFGLTHLTPYCVKYLGLSEDVAGNFVRVARKSKQVPELKQVIARGNLTVSKAKAIVAVLTPENHDHWITKAKVLSKDKLEREVAKVSPYNPKSEKAKPVGESNVAVSMELPEEVMRMFRRAQEIVSQKTGKSVTLAETQAETLKAFLHKFDPVEKAKRAKAEPPCKASAIIAARAENGAAIRTPAEHPSRDGSNGGASTQSPPSHSSRPLAIRRAGIPAAVVHAVNRRDKGCCQAKLPSGEICGSRRWTHLHHLNEKFKGGSDTLENLITLCSGHHRLWHKYSPGRLEGEE